MFELVLVGLFVALTPGILFKLKGTKMVAAAAHAALFGVVVYVVSSYFISYDGFQAGPQPICPSGTTYSDGLCRSSVVCPSGYTYARASGRCIKSAGPTQKPACPANTIMDNELCYEYMEVNCPSGGRTDGDNCVIEPTSCPEPYVLTRGQCITPPQTKSMSMLQASKSTSFTKAPAKVGTSTNASSVSSVTDKNGNTISVGSIASCVGAKGTFNITVTRIESSPNSTIVRGTVNGSKKAYKLSSCSAVTASESIFG